MYAVNRLPKQDIANSPTGCCPKFEPDKWDDQLFEFKNKLFLKVSTRSFLHVPLNMGSVFKKAMASIDAADAKLKDEYLILSEEISPWKADHYITVVKEVPGAKMVRLTGKYYTKVFEGPFKDAAKWHTQLANEVRAKGEKPSKLYFFYTTCPKCAKVYGKNYVVGFALL